MPLHLCHQLFNQTEHENPYLITNGEPLANPFRIGEVFLHSGKIIQSQEDRTAAFAEYFPYHLDNKSPHVIKQLNEIAYKVMCGEQVTLVCTCNSPHCHGYFLIDLIERRISNA